MSRMLTDEQIEDLKIRLERIHDYIPEAEFGPIWKYCNILRGDRQPQPCGCPSAAGLWGRCVELLRGYIKSGDI